jgi:hypothetical protein
MEEEYNLCKNADGFQVGWVVRRFTAGRSDAGVVILV